MVDRITPQERSELMSKIRSEGTKLERGFLTLLRQAGLKPTRGNHMDGKPDFVFRRARIAIFIDSCYWHGCRWHCRMPKSNVKYWSKKIARNKARDKAITDRYRSDGWSVIRIWEHSLRNHPAECLAKLLRCPGFNRSRDAQRIAKRNL